MLSSLAVKRVGVALVVAGAPMLHVVVPGATWIRTSAALAGGRLVQRVGDKASDAGHGIQRGQRGEQHQK